MASSQSRSISKAAFLNAITCHTLGWYSLSDEHRETPSDAGLLRMQEGTEIGLRAQLLWPGGIEADRTNTANLIEDESVIAVFEARFVVDGYVAKADVLYREGERWHLVEVKSSLNDKPEFVDDLAYTAMVMARVGIEPATAQLLLLSRDYRLGLSAESLFAEPIDHTEAVRARVREFDSQWSVIRERIAASERPEPVLAFGCRKCTRFATDCIGQGVSDHVFDLPRISAKKFAGLQAEGLDLIADIPEDFKLTDKQAVVREAVIASQSVIDRDALRAVLTEVAWPAYYLDFETTKTAIPLYENVAPHEQLPTQYSLHVCAAPGNVTDHREYLADPATDCRRELAQQLVEDLDQVGSIVVYHATMEKGVIAKLAERFPDLEANLTALLGRVFDLEVAITKGIYHPEFRGKSSIKYTLPALVSDMTYDDMAIADGDTAMTVFARMARGELDEAEATAAKDDLRSYCLQDTLAMVRLHQTLLGLCDA